MSKPNNVIKEIQLPDNSVHEIVPKYIQDGTSNYVATVPTLTEDKTIATTDELPKVKRFI